MAKRASNILFGLVASAITAASIAASAQSPLAVHPGSVGTFLTFDAPGAGTGYQQGTIPVTLNRKGAVTGRYIDSHNVYHGFVITLSGSVVTFDAPGAGTGNQQGTLPYGISPNGTIVGFLFDSKNVRHGFLCAPMRDHTCTVIDTPLHNINASGEASGFFDDANNVRHGVFRSPQGEITLFDMRGAGTSSGQGTFVCPGCLNDYGVVPGRYVDSNNVSHGYVRNRRRDKFTFTSYDVPGGVGTFTSSINNPGQITGISLDANNAAHAYIRDPGGAITSFDVPGAGTGPGQGTFLGSINNRGVSFGYYVDSANVSHGFVRSVQGTFRILDAPGAGTSNQQGTQGGTIIDSGLVTGNYVDANYVQHGYLWVSALP